MNYYVMALAPNKNEEWAEIHDKPDNLPFKSYHLDKAKPLADRLSEPIRYHFFAERKGTKLVDLQFNVLGLFIVSPKMRELLTGHGNMEFLPIELYDHDGKLASDTHTLANFLDKCDFVDYDKSEYVIDPLDEEEFFSVDKLVFDEKKIDPAIDIFRMKQIPLTVILSERLFEKLRKADVEGPLFVPIEEFSSFDHLGV